MVSTLRIATFNCENLFSRPKIFRESKVRSTELLGYVAELQAELRNDVFDHPRIKELKEKLQGYMTVVDIRGSHTSAAGAKEWLGWVEFTKSRNEAAAVENTAQVIYDLDADLICLIEVENRLLLQQFHDGLLFDVLLKPQNKLGYEHVLLIDGNDDRGIDVSVISRLPITWLKSHVHERTTYAGREIATFSRDCLEVRLEAPDGNPLHLLVNHLKSQGYNTPTDPQGNIWRLGQAKRVAELVDEHDLDQDYVVVAGDLNADPDNPSMAPLVKKKGLYNVNLELEPDKRGTYGTEKKQLDYLFISRALRPHLQAVHIERRGIYSKSRPHYPTVTSKLDQASDHGAVVAEFQL
jgi:endonuclease/exonuclease/phosphatase family metal-dependent hydrolase